MAVALPQAKLSQSQHQPKQNKVSLGGTIMPCLVPSLVSFLSLRLTIYSEKNALSQPNIFSSKLTLPTAAATAATTTVATATLTTTTTT